jgi:hypothetical protein
MRRLIQIGVSSLTMSVPSKPRDSLIFAPDRLAASEFSGPWVDELTGNTEFAEPAYVTIRVRMLQSAKVSLAQCV